MTKEKVQNKVQTIQWPKKKYKIKYRQSNDQRKSTKWSTDNPMTKEKVQHKVQRIQWPKKGILYLINIFMAHPIKII
jgi:prolyl oligopeptidase PreP (S9A serine peptidase family)